jgi:succinate dehydrogenase / fumarate reductase iron-sulfur subunit
MTDATFRIWRGERQTGAFKDYTTPVAPGMVVLDAIHASGRAGQRPRAPLELQGGKYGSCSAGSTACRSSCMTRCPICRCPRRSPFNDARVPDHPRPRDRRIRGTDAKGVDPMTRRRADGTQRMAGGHRACKSSGSASSASVPGRLPRPARASGARALRRAAPVRVHRGLEMPRWTRTAPGPQTFTARLCNITKCCNVCPENIAITDNAISRSGTSPILVRWAACSVTQWW